MAIITNSKNIYEIFGKFGGLFRGPHLQTPWIDPRFSSKAERSD